MHNCRNVMPHLAYCLLLTSILNGVTRFLYIYIKSIIISLYILPANDGDLCFVLLLFNANKQISTSILL